ncbi:hypothetical protein [Branchiibius sp. NY16-3462-2]|uniref:hypothetical protein n=1 Tax=Branchiibius sp. NY16-3462-2 TaxID=1807500 RepID=UPI00079530FB|nr:hypothetical protein [Branchiibius sp. NY16-3462-2]KYH42948.1 hypothetical protein AZH51_05695 [Branchiibius sp. NY16-3462-2]
MIIRAGLPVAFPAEQRHARGRTLAALIIAITAGAVVLAWCLAHHQDVGLADPRPVSAPAPSLLYPVGYLLLLGGWGTLAYCFAWTPYARWLGGGAALCAVGAALAHLVRDVLLMTGTAAPPILAVLATAALVGLVPASIALIVGPLVLARVLTARRRLSDRRTHAGNYVVQIAPHSAAAPDGDQQGARWRRAYVPAAVTPFGPGSGPGTAICLSGGGVRSASVALGAMQQLTRPPKDLHPAVEPDYVVSVSGGGYTAGAYLQALGRNDEPPAPRRLGQVFGESSEEYEWIRRHSSYIADTPGALVVALGTLARCLVVTQLLLWCPAVVFGILAGALYARVPLAAISPVGNRDVPLNQGAWWLVAILSVTFLVAIFGACVCEYGRLPDSTAGSTERTGPDRWRWLMMRLATGVCAALLLTVLVTIAAPSVMRVADALFEGSTRHLVWTGSVVALVNYAAVVATILWRRRGIFAKVAGWFGKGGQGAPAAVPRGMLQLLIVVATLAVIALAWVVTFGGVAVWAFENRLSGGDGRAVLALLIAISLLWLMLANLDVTSSSLHPFYRRRLARAFAVRPPASGRPGARPYDFGEFTQLQKFGTTATPQFVFAAATTLSGAAQGEAGLTATSYTIGPDFVGGPDVGWIATGDLARLVRGRVQRDLTVQAAVATSGGAFASSMGRSSTGIEKLLAISGARLGTWLPNPEFMARSSQVAASERGPGYAWRFNLPTYRGAGYLYAELLGLHPAWGRLVQVTDGGHYENLGLVEALRRRCHTIVCIDAGGDTPPNLSGLGEAVRLAEAELGVQITFDDGALQDLAPGTGAPFGPADDFAALNARITKGCVLEGRIDYPAASGLDPQHRRGRLIFAKAVLWQGCPPWLMTYANTKGHEVFPYDSTADQWFDEGQFAAYAELGRLIGQEALGVLHQPVRTGTARPQTPGLAA